MTPAPTCRLLEPRYATVLLFCLAGCADGIDRASAPVASVTDSAGVEIVAISNSDGPSLALHETLRLGREDDTGPELFSRVVAVLLDDSGRVIVGNGSSHSVRVFDAAGRLVSEFGSAGKGPADIVRLNDVAMGGDTIALIDWQRGGKVVLFRSDGDFLTSFATHRSLQKLYTVRGGTAKGWLWSVADAKSPSIAPGDSLVRLASIGIMAPDSLGDVTPLYSVPGVALYGTPGAEGGIDWGLFSPRRALGFDAAGRMYLTDPQSYRIDVFDGTMLVRSVRRDVEPYRLKPSDAEAVGDEVNAVIDTLTMPSEEYRTQERKGMAARVATWKQLPIPPVLAPINAMLVSRDGSFWIQVQDTSNPARTEAQRNWARDNFPVRASRWHLYNDRGMFVGAVDLPARYRAEAVAGTTVVGVWADENDVEYVVRYEARHVPPGERLR